MKQPKADEVYWLCTHTIDLYDSHVYAILSKNNGYVWYFLCDDCDNECDRRSMEDPLTVLQSLTGTRGVWSKNMKPIVYVEEFA